MFDHISPETCRACLEALVQLHREQDGKGVHSFLCGLEDAAESPYGDMTLAMLAQIGKATWQQED